MATKDQYEFFNQRYIEESERQRDLLKKSQLYFTVVTAISSFLFTNITTLKDIVKADDGIKITISILIVDLCLILFLLFKSIKVQDYVLPINTEEYVNNLPADTSEEESDKDFFDNRVADFISAIDKNQNINNDKADFIKYSEYAIIGFIFITLIITLQIVFSK
jgi:hypothetical protein